jgi:hypothetical protein
MSGYTERDWSARRRKAGGRRFRANAVWILSSILVAAVAALLVVGQKVRFNGVRMATDAARNRNEVLRSDWNSHQVRHQRQATRAELLPVAVAMGFTEPTAESVRLVSFGAADDPSEPGLMDRIVGPAMAGEPAASRPDPRSAGGSAGR